MAKKQVSIDPAVAVGLISEIGKVKAWITGFEAAGKMGPPGADSLRQAQIVLKEALAKAAKSERTR